MKMRVTPDWFGQVTLAFITACGAFMMMRAAVEFQPKVDAVINPRYYRMSVGTPDPIVIDLLTKEVHVPPGADLDAASKEFWKKVIENKPPDEAQNVHGN